MLSAFPETHLTDAAQNVDWSRVAHDFAEHGYARIGKVVAEEALVALRARSDELMLGTVVHPGMFFQHDSSTGRYQDLELGGGYCGPSLHYRKMEKLERDPLFLAFMENPLFAQIARFFIEDQAVLYRAVVFNKAPQGGTELLWHQDAGRFWGLDRDPFLQIWTALDDTPEESGCVRLLQGTHKRGLATPLGGIVPQALVDEELSKQQPVLLPAEAGEVLLIHNMAWHASSVNKTDVPRRALTLCIMTEQTRCLRKKRAPREFFPLFR